MKIHVQSVLLGSLLVTSIGLLFSFQQVMNATHFGLTSEQKAVLDILSVETLPDGMNGPGYKTLRVNGVNLQVVNGVDDDTSNGLGNILVGYMIRTSDSNGSHNVVTGSVQKYTANASILGGYGNEVNAAYGIVFGTDNIVDSPFGTILGGVQNLVSVTNGDPGMIVCGNTNTVYGPNSSILCGQFNTTNNSFGVIVGGQANVNNGVHGVIVGGTNNAIGTLGSNAVLGGGNTRTATGVDDWVAGSLFEDN